MLPRVSAEPELWDEDYFVRLLAFIWRFRAICVLILVIGAVTGIASQSRRLPLRTVLAMRLVSPCVAYRHTDYWTPSGKAWRSQLSAGLSKYAGPNLEIAVRAGDEPWLINVTAEHDQADSMEKILRGLVRETEIQLGVTRFSPPVFDVMTDEAVENTSSTAMGLMAQLRFTLTRLEKLLSEIQVEQAQEVGIPLSTTSDARLQQMSGTWSPVPVQSVPYFPWFERLHKEVCWYLSNSAPSLGAGHQMSPKQLELTTNLEQASVLVTQVWFSMDPLNPVQRLPEGQVQSVYTSPNSDVSILLNAGRGCWFSLGIILVGAMLGEWFTAKWRMIVYASRDAMARTSI